MSQALTIGPRLTVAARIETYVTLLPLGVEALCEAIDNEVAENPWLETIPRVSRDEATPLAATLDSAAAKNLAEHLFAQLTAQRASPAVLRCARVVIGSLDEQAYLRESLTDIARAARTDPRNAERALALVQSFEPTGVAARGLGERFRLQLEGDGDFDPLTRTLTFELADLAHDGPEATAVRLQVGAPALARALGVLRRLDPYPASDFGRLTQYVRPELIFTPTALGWRVQLDDRLWPEVRFVSLTAGRGLSGPMSEARTRALRLVDALARRRMTLQRLGEALVDLQRAYLVSGGDASALVPLRGRDLARVLGCAESTISRALTARYVRTPFGTRSLRAFLATSPGSLALTTGDLRSRVRAATERAGAPLSDAQIVRLLARGGIRVARRTVAKYRQQLAIPSTRGRRGR